jgi:hypothetical protein
MPHMAPAVLFLLLGIWMQELSVVGMRNAPLLGAASLASSALVLLRYRRRASLPTRSMLAALGRAAQTTTRPPRRAVRVVQ